VLNGLGEEIYDGLHMQVNSALSGEGANDVGRKVQQSYTCSVEERKVNQKFDGMSAEDGSHEMMKYKCSRCLRN
jgi:hypothetical protein